MSEEKRPWEQVFEPPPPPPLGNPVVTRPEATQVLQDQPTPRRLAAVPAPTPTLAARAVAWCAEHQLVVNPDEVETHETGVRFELRCRGTEEATRAIGLVGRMGEEFRALVEVTPDEHDPLRVRIDLGEPGSAGTEGPARQTVAYLPVEVRTAVDRARAVTGDSFTEFFLQAFNRQYDRLGEIFPNRTRSTGPMPLRTTQRRRRATAGNLVQAWIYLTDEQRAVLDEAEQRVGAGSRSALISKILESDLTNTQPVFR